jgi:hypothetical protein
MNEFLSLRKQVRIYIGSKCGMFSENANILIKKKTSMALVCELMPTE